MSSSHRDYSRPLRCDVYKFQFPAIILLSRTCVLTTVSLCAFHRLFVPLTLAEKLLSIHIQFNTRCGILMERLHFANSLAMIFFFSPSLL